MCKGLRRLEKRREEKKEEKRRALVEESYVGLEVDQMTLKSSSSFIILCSVEAWGGFVRATPNR